MKQTFDHSFKKSLQLIAKERNLQLAEVWHNVVSERFLVRLCRSPYQSHFILKGGTLLAKHVQIGRETRDLDFTIRGLQNGVEALQQVLDEIVEVALDDGFTFSRPKVVLVKQFPIPYPAIQVKMAVHFGKNTSTLFLDLGFGDDAVEERVQTFSLLKNASGPLFEPEVTLACYPLSFVFAEKFETVIYRGVNNSRMKDFHDLYTLVTTEKLLDGKETEKAVLAVFTHRKTPLQPKISFSADELGSLQYYWERYRPSAGVAPQLPEEIGLVIETINRWLDSNTDLP